jgi:hypothetical protein
MVLRSGDFFRIRIRPNVGADVHVKLTDMTGKTSTLFPETEKVFPEAGVAPRNPIPGGTDLWVPNKPWSFELDDNEGREFLEVIVTRQQESVTRKIWFLHE